MEMAKARKQAVLRWGMMAALVVGFLYAEPLLAQNPNDILVIAHSGVSVDRLSAQEVKAFFLKKRSNWRGGDRVNPINQKDGTSIRRQFQEKVLGFSAADEKVYWKDMEIKKGTRAPASLSNVLKAVFSLRGSISYCYRKDYKKGVGKIVLVL